MKWRWQESSANRFFVSIKKPTPNLFHPFTLFQKMKKQRLLAAAFLAAFFAFPAFSQNTWTSTAVDFKPHRLGWIAYPTGANDCWAYSIQIGPNFETVLTEPRYNRTTDGGLTWSDALLPFSPNSWIGNFSPTDGQTTWACGHSETDGPQIFKTTDGGATWVQKGTAGLTVWLNQVHFFDQNEGFALGDPDANSLFEINKTTDGGQTWLPIANPPAAETQEVAYTGVYDFNGDKILVPTSYDRVLYSADRGATWVTYERPDDGIGFIWEQMLAADGTVFLSMSNFTDIANVFRRRPSDSTWTTAHESTEDFFYGLDQVPGTKTIIGNSRGLTDLDIWKTKISYDDGATWSTVLEDTIPLGFLRFTSPSTGYSVSRGIDYDNGPTQIFRYTGSPLTGLLTAKPLNLEVSVFPNPTADLVQIQFENAENEAFWLLLNDASGRLLARKTVEKGQPGRAFFDLKNEPSGVYRLTVASEKGSTTRSVVKN